MGRKMSCGERNRMKRFLWLLIASVLFENEVMHLVVTIALLDRISREIPHISSAMQLNRPGSGRRSES